MVLKSQKKLTSWKTWFLSIANKIILIKANLASSLLYAMNCFKLAKGNNEDLDKINRKFLWIWFSRVSLRMEDLLLSRQIGQ